MYKSNVVAICESLVRICFAMRSSNPINKSHPYGNIKNNNKNLNEPAAYKHAHNVLLCVR